MSRTEIISLLPIQSLTLVPSSVRWGSVGHCSDSGNHMPVLHSELHEGWSATFFTIYGLVSKC